MTVEVRLRPEAEQDLVEAALWYEANGPTLGGKFLDQVQSALVTIAEQPVAYPMIYKSVRRALVKRFPFGTFCTVDDTGVIVIAALHGSRHPRVWRERAQQA